MVQGRKKPVLSRRRRRSVGTKAKGRHTTTHVRHKAAPSFGSVPFREIDATMLAALYKIKSSMETDAALASCILHVELILKHRAISVARKAFHLI